MYTFLLSIVVLTIGYFVYGSYIERVYGADEKRITPSQRMSDGVDFVELPWYKIFLIQFLNIAGTGPIFGAVAGAFWGPAAFVWIVFGCIFGGMVHDYLSGMLSIRHDGASITEVIREYLGDHITKVFTVFCLLILILVGAVFITSPAAILNNLTKVDQIIWVVIIICYYLVATVLPVDKIIGRIYPFFGLAFLFMGLGLLGGMFFTGSITQIPEFSFKNLHPEGLPIYPFLLLSIACGAISGFHATQAPMMARCIKSEKEGKKVFAGAMAMEGIVALIWAAGAMAFFGGPLGMVGVGSAPVIVSTLSIGMLGPIGGFLVLLGVVVFPITSGDTAFRSARLIVADFLKINQTKIINRFTVAVPLFVIGVGLTFIDFTILWRYFAWANQTLTIFPLLVGAIYLYRKGKNYFIALIPCLFMTMLTTTYILQAKEGFRLSISLAYILAVCLVVLVIVLFYRLNKKEDLSR